MLSYTTQHFSTFILIVPVIRISNDKDAHFSMVLVDLNAVNLTIFKTFWLKIRFCPPYVSLPQHEDF